MFKIESTESSDSDNNINSDNNMAGHVCSKTKEDSSSPKLNACEDKLICILCIGIIDEPANNSRIRTFVSQRTVALVYSTFASYLIISVAFLFGKLVKDHWPWKSSAALSFVGFILYVACAATLLKDWVETKERNYWPPNAHRLDMVCATGFICVIGAIVFLIDTILTARSGSRGDLGN